jgi:hypothetical protein
MNLMIMGILIYTLFLAKNIIYVYYIKIFQIKKTGLKNINNYR